MLAFSFSLPPEGGEGGSCRLSDTVSVCSSGVWALAGMVAAGCTLVCADAALGLLLAGLGPLLAAESTGFWPANRPGN